MSEEKKDERCLPAVIPLDEPALTIIPADEKPEDGAVERDRHSITKILGEGVEVGLPWVQKNWKERGRA